MSQRRARTQRRLRPSQVKAFSFPTGAKFNAKEDLLDPAEVLRAIHRHPDIRDELVTATTFVHHYGRPRQEGSWGLIMLAFARPKSSSTRLSAMSGAAAPSGTSLALSARRANSWSGCG